MPIIRRLHLGRMVLGLMAPALLWQDATAGAVKELYSVHSRIGDYIYGTQYFVEYEFGNAESEALRIGDRVKFHCVLLSGDPPSVPCDSFDLTTTLGERGLPLAVEWAVLGNKSGLTWDQSIQACRAVLDDRFTTCGADSNDCFAFRLHITELDTTGRARVTSEQKTLQRAILTLRERYDPEVAADLKPLVGKLGKSDFFRALYAEALVWAGLCVEYGRQSSLLAKRGYWDARFSQQQEAANCSKWQKPPYELH